MRKRLIGSSFTVLAAVLTPVEAARAASPTSLGITAGSGSTACVFSVTGSLLAPCVVMVDPTTGTPIVTAAGTPATSALGIQGVTGGTPVPASLNATPSIANGNGVVPTQGGNALSATNGGYTNVLQGNVALGATNGLYANLLQGNAVISATNGLYGNLLQGNAVLSSSNPLFVQNTVGSAIIGKVDLLGNVGAIMDFAGQNAASPANALMIGGQYNATPTTITTGNASPFQMDNAGNLLVNVKAGGGSGGTSLADNAAWTSGTTAQTPIGCEYTSGGAAALTTGHVGTPGCTASRQLFNDIEAIGGTGSFSTYASTPGSVPALPVNAFVTNTLTALAWGQNGVTASTTGSPTLSALMAYNGSTLDSLEDDANKNLKTAPQASPVGGALPYGPLFSAASNNATNVKASAGTVYSITVTQSTTTALELKLYNSAASPTCSSATNLVDLIPIPSNATSPGYHLPYPVGRAFSAGISFCLVAFGAPASGTDNGNAVTGATVSMTYD